MDKGSDLDRQESPELIWRRRFFLSLAGSGAALATLSALFVARDLVPPASRNPDRLPPQVGDILVHATGHPEGTPVDPSQLAPGGPLVLAFPMDPKTKVVRNGDPKNTLLVLRQDPATLSPEVARYAPQGVSVYSAVCTHLGCIVSLWLPERHLAQCPCHGGEYDLARDQVVSGPPPRPIPLLAVRLEGRAIVVSGPFSGPVGVQTG